MFSRVSAQSDSQIRMGHGSCQRPTLDISGDIARVLDVKILSTASPVGVWRVEEDRAIRVSALPFGRFGAPGPIAIVDHHISEPIAQCDKILLKANASRRRTPAARPNRMVRPLVSILTL